MVPTAKRYIRARCFNRNANGQIVTIDGYVLQPGFVVPPEATDVHINTSGEVFAHIEGQAEMQSLGQLNLASFINDAGLEPVGDNLFRANEASGQAVTGRSGGYRVWHDPSGLSGKFERGCGEGDYRDDRRSARIRNEFKGDQGR
jgi:flagellar basal body rod protein FlgG